MQTVAANVVSCSALVAPVQRRCLTNPSSSLSYSCWTSLRSSKLFKLSREVKAARICLVCNISRAAADIDRGLRSDVPTPAAFTEEERIAEEGIRCYLTEAGEIQCEGFDEGPHFHPVARAQQRIVMNNANHMAHLTRGVSVAQGSPTEVTVYNVVREKRGETYCEGKDES